MSIKNKNIIVTLLILLVITSNFSILYAFGKKPDSAIQKSSKNNSQDSINNKKLERPGQSKKNISDQSNTIEDEPSTTISEEPTTQDDSTVQETNNQTENNNPEPINSTETNDPIINQTIMDTTPSSSLGINTTQVIYSPGDDSIIGINYHSIWWHYNDAEGTTDEVLNRDFRLFKTQGIDKITLLIQWSYLEPSKGYYRESYIQDINRVVGVAEKYDIKCIIDFHTAGSFSMPSWTPRRLTDIVLDAPTREAFLQMQKYAISQLDGPNIHSYHLFNEPYLTKSSDPGSTWLGVTRDQALDLLQEIYDNAKTITSKPCSIRYGSDSVMQSSQFADDPRVWSSCDYITVNYYVAYHSEYYLRQIVEKAHSQGKEVMIGEFGYRDVVNNDDELQRQKVADHIQLFQDIGLDYAMAWIWRADKVINDGSYAPVGGGYNLAANLNGDPRPAFYEIGRANNLNVLS